MNAYIMYVNVNALAGEKKKDLMSHHDFRKSIAFSWIKSTAVKPSQGVSVLSRKRGRGDEDVSEASSVTMSTMKSVIQSMRGIKRRATPVNDASVASTSTLSRLRLDPTLDHILDIAKSSARCAIHRWVGIELERNTYFCSTCNVNLCIICNRAFHQVPDLLSNKNSLKHRYNQIRNKNKKQT